MQVIWSKKSNKLQLILIPLSSYMQVEQANTAVLEFLLVNCLGQWMDFNEIDIGDFYFKKICQENPNWIQIGQKYLALYMKIIEDL